MPSRIPPGGKDRGAEGDGKQEAPEGAGSFSRQMRHSLNPQIIDRAPSLLKGPWCLLHLGGPCFPPYLWLLETGKPVTLVTQIGQAVSIHLLMQVYFLNPF